MLVNLKPKFYFHLAELLEKMGRDADQHYGLSDDEKVVEPWEPSDREDSVEINCELTVGDLNMAKELYAQLKNGYEEQK